MRYGLPAPFDYPSEQAWRDSICDIAIRDARLFLDDIRNGSAADIEMADKALTKLLKLSPATLSQTANFQETAEIWRAADEAVDEWSSAEPAVVAVKTKALKLLANCTAALDSIYYETVGDLLQYIEEHNDSTWVPVATELLSFIRLPPFHAVTATPFERIHIRATVRRWMAWSTDAEFLETCDAFLRDFKMVIAV